MREVQPFLRDLRNLRDLRMPQVTRTVEFTFCSCRPSNPRPLHRLKRISPGSGSG
jgi:hypothetical protein